MPFDGKPQDSTLDLIRQVRVRIARPGAWCQKIFHDPRGAHCIAGWLMVVTATLSEQSKVHRYLNIYANELGFPGIYEFNDDSNTTQEDVVSFLDRAGGV